MYLSILVTVLVMSIKGDQTYCNKIKDHDDRMLCRAEATGSRTWCNLIRDSDKRQKCNARVKR